MPSWEESQALQAGLVPADVSGTTDHILLTIEFKLLLMLLLMVLLPQSSCASLFMFMCSAVLFMSFLQDLHGEEGYDSDAFLSESFATSSIKP